MTKFTGHKLKLDEQKIETPSVFTIRYRWISIPLAGADVPCKYSLGLKWFFIQFIIKYVLDVVFSLLLPRCMMTEHFMC